MAQINPTSGYRRLDSWVLAITGRNAGKEFWGCTGYPECKGVREVEIPKNDTKKN
ncbi:MAG: hypothetical protein LBU51_06880 [Bacteroidales bacterium]|jgi:ssDNA-binding Zn-finger/Zn-ribbon topoisomerase 1|nr:hypothetical protein [Bacteroidales bacterium]